MLYPTELRAPDGVLNGGEGGIRTPGRDKPSAVFKTAAIDHSATSPEHGPRYFISNSGGPVACGEEKAQKKRKNR